MIVRAGIAGMVVSLALGCVAPLALGCVAPPAARPPPRVPSTHRDPPTHLPAPTERGETGTVASLAASSGDEQARDLVVALVIGIRDQDAAAVEALLAPAIVYTSTLRQGRSAASVGAPAFAAHLVSAARAAHVRGDARLEELVELGSIRVAPIAAAFPDGLPRELEPGDRVVRFEVTPLGRRALAALARDGAVALVIRPGQGARIVGR